jgi:hypothetical protein
MSGTPTYIPEARKYLQLVLGGPTGGVDCTAWMAARLAAAQSRHFEVTGRQIRLASDEPVPDPDSPGLNLPQVDAALRHLTGINLDTRIGIADHTAQAYTVAGRWMGLQVNRGVLVDKGYAGGSRFRGGHAITVHSADGVPVIGDSLVPYYERTSWSTIWAAAAALQLGNGHIVGAGRAYACFTRDTTRDYEVVIHPRYPHKRQSFNVYRVENGKIPERNGRTTAATGGLSADCTQPRLHAWPGHSSKSLVQLTTGSRKGEWIYSGWAEEKP